MRLRHIAYGVAVLVLVGQCTGLGDEDAPAEAGSAVVERDAAPEPQRKERAPRTSSPKTPSKATSTPTRTPTPSPTREPTQAPSQEPRAGTALAVLAALAVKGRAPMTGYDRDRFGPAWLDADRNGCDTRNDVLAATLTGVVLESNGCVVSLGAYQDPYTGSTIDYRHGDGTLIDIDHVVAMGNAWATGASGWGVKKRAAFANDPLNLLPADAGANRQKGDGDAATWLPSYKPFRCDYVARQVAVKDKYDLWVTAPEKAAVERVLAACPGQPVTADTWRAPTRVDHDITDPGAAPDPAPSRSPSPSPVPLVGTSVHYENCDAARAAGADPVRRGDPGYGTHLDRDQDGVACE